MYQHHKESLDHLVAMYKENKEVLAVIIAGSIAKGKEKVDSDIDVIIIVSEAMYAKLEEEQKISEVKRENITYEKGYFDIKYHTKDFIKKAAESGSEPTRNSFIGTRCVFSRDEEIDEIIKKIPVYPVWEKEDRIQSYYTNLIVYQGFFWNQAKKTNDVYLRMRTATDIVLYGLRMLYAYNETLFPCHKWLLRVANELEEKPEAIVNKAEVFLENLDDVSKDDFVQSILGFCDWKIPEGFSVITKFVADNEQWWYNNRPNIAEW